MERYVFVVLDFTKKLVKPLQARSKKEDDAKVICDLCVLSTLLLTVFTVQSLSADVVAVADE